MPDAPEAAVAAVMRELGCEMEYGDLDFQANPGYCAEHVDGRGDYALWTDRGCPVAVAAADAAVDAARPSIQAEALREATGALADATWCHLDAPDLDRLDLASIPVHRWLDTPYLVGSCLRRPDYRDVDIRVVLADERYDQLFGVPPLYKDALRHLLQVTITDHYVKATGLRIDFQIQRRTDANDKYPEPGYRHPLGIYPYPPEPAEQRAEGGARCRDCGAQWVPVRRGECLHCGSDGGPAPEADHA